MAKVGPIGRFVSELGDAIDSESEMPERYGSRSYWRYNQMIAWLATLGTPVSILLLVVDQSTTIGAIVSAGAVLALIVLAVWLIRRDIRAQKRLDTTGSPLVDREPY